jgi:hypothetical protein
MKLGKSKLFFIILFLAIFLFLIYILTQNYYNGKTFKLCKECEPNEVSFIDVKVLPDNLVKVLQDKINTHCSVLNPSTNFNNAKGKKLNYNQLPKEIIEFYDNEYYKNSVSAILKQDVTYADKTERYRIFARLYDNENDFLDWHYDNNFTMGDRYTLVIPVLVDSGNTSEFMIKDRNTGIEKVIPIPIGKGVIYNGSITYHSISQQTKGNNRMVIIIPFYTNYNKSLMGHIREFIRNLTDTTLAL